MLQHCVPGMASALPIGAGTASGTQRSIRAATFTVRGFEGALRLRSAAGPIFEDDVISFRARGREADSHQPSR